MDYASHRGITLILFGRSAMHHVCLFDGYLLDGLKSSLLKKCFCDLNLYEVVKSSGLVVQRIQLMMTSSKQREFTFNCFLKDIKRS